MQESVAMREAEYKDGVVRGLLSMGPMNAAVTQSDRMQTKRRIAFCRHVGKPIRCLG